MFQLVFVGLSLYRRDHIDCDISENILNSINRFLCNVLCFYLNFMLLIWPAAQHLLILIDLEKLAVLQLH